MTGAQHNNVISAVRGYASAVVGCAVDDVTSVSRFDDGNRHDVYKVSCMDARRATTTDVVVRVSLTRDPAERAQAAQEASVLQTVGGTAAPSLYDFSDTCSWFDRPAMCMQFIPGTQREMSSASLAEFEKLGAVLGWVHDRPTADLETAFATSGTLLAYAEARLESIVAGLGWVRDPLPLAIQRSLEAAAASLQQSFHAQHDASSFSSEEASALLHGDPAAGNILWSPDPVLIDWEYARLGDPADEIAYLFDQNGLRARQREAFWRGYRHGRSVRGRPGDVEDRVTWWEPVTLLGSTLWWVERWVRRSDAEAAGTADPAVVREQTYYSDHVARRLDRLNDLLSRTS